jgi:autotransporter-associated beta strand protein
MSRTHAPRTIMMAVALSLTAPPAFAGWIGATTGATNDAAHNYNNTTNWSGGVIDDLFPATLSLTGNLTLYLHDDHATGADGFRGLYNDGGSGNLTLQANTGTRTLYLNGPLVYNPVLNRTLTLQSSLILDLNGGVREFEAVRAVQVNAVIANGGLTKTGSGELRISSASTYGGTTTIREGTFTLRDADGSVLNSPRIDVLGGTLNIASRFGLNNNRIADDAVINLRGGNLTYTGRDEANVASSETLGAVKLQQGLANFDLRYGSTGANNPHPGATTTLNITELSRENRSLAFVRGGDNNGGVGGGGVGVAHNRMLAGNTISQIGGDGSRSTNFAVVPWVLTDTGLGNGNSLSTYDASLGFRPLDRSTEFITNINSAHADGNDNALITSSQTLTASRTIAGLVVESNLTIAASQTLTVKSGAVRIGTGISGPGTLDFGSAEGVIHSRSGSVQTITAPISGTGGLTTVTSGPNNQIVLSGDNTYTGQTTVAFGQLRAHHSNTLPANDLVLVHENGQLVVGSSNQATAAVAGRVGGIAGNGVVRLGNISGSNTANYSRLIIGGGSGDQTFITLDGGYIAPGMPGETGSLAITVDAFSSAAVPVVLKNGTLQIDLAGANDNDQLNVTGSVDVANGGSLGIAVNFLGDFVPVLGQQWTILTAASVTDANGGVLFDSLTPGFQAAIVGGNSIVLTFIPEPGTLVLLAAGTLLIGFRRQARV